MKFKIGDRIYIDGEKWRVVDTDVKSPSGLDVEAVNEDDCTLFVCFSSDDADDIKFVVRGVIMIKVELEIDGDLLYLDGKLITFEQGVHGDYWVLDGVGNPYDTLEELILCS